MNLKKGEINTTCIHERRNKNSVPGWSTLKSVVTEPGCIHEDTEVAGIEMLRPVEPSEEELGWLKFSVYICGGISISVFRKWHFRIESALMQVWS